MSEETEVLREVPVALQRLVRFIVRGFYGVEHALVLDVLVRNACVKEEDIQELMKYDKKQLRAILTHLKNDKLLKCRLCVETQPDGKMARHNYYYINYRSIVNVIKYKLHHMHKRIETSERDANNRASFKCPTCSNTYTDLEVEKLLDPFLGTLNCIFCHTEVEEDAASESAQSLRTSQAKFNEQIEPIYKLLREAENVNLSIEVLEPEPTIIPHLHPNASRPNKSRVDRESSGGHWADPTANYNLDYHQDIVINIGDHKEEKVKAKEVPIWMAESTVSKKNNHNTHAAVSSIANNSNSFNTSQTNDVNKQDSNEVLQMIMSQERSSKSTSSFSNITTLSHVEQHKSDSSDGEQPSTSAFHVSTLQESDEEESDFEDAAMVMVAGKEYSYTDVAERGQELVQLMTPSEKQHYIELGQQMYQDMHD